MRPELRLRSRTPAQTRKIGATVAAALQPGDVVALTGELGAGKTCFVQGAADALGVTERVTSPSFLLRRDYAGRFPVLHLDVYRLDTLAEVAELGYEEVGDQQHVTFIEWGDAMSPLLPREHLELEFHLPPLVSGPPEPHAEPAAEAEERTIVLRARGAGWRRRLPGLAVDLVPWRPTDNEAHRC